MSSPIYLRQQHLDIREALHKILHLLLTLLDIIVQLDLLLYENVQLPLLAVNLLLLHLETLLLFLRLAAQF